MKKKSMIRRTASLLMAAAMLFALASAAFAATASLDRAWTKDQEFTLADPAPWNLEELKQVVDVQDPRSVAAYWVWSVNRLIDDYDDGMEMMKYLFADIEPYGSGYYEGGMSGKAGWDTYFNERLKDADYKWLPRAYFEGGSARNGFAPTKPLTLELYYNSTNTETINKQTLEDFGRLNIVYWVKSYAGGNQVNITVSKFTDSDRWYVTSGTSSAALFYDQRSALEDDELAAAKAVVTDTSTEAEHKARYGGEEEVVNPFTDVADTDYYYDAVLWAAENGVTTGTSATTFGPGDTCTRGQVVTFLWRAAGQPEPSGSANPFSDVKESDYFYKAVLWAVEKGITTGATADSFAPKNTCSSAHIITFLYRAVTGSTGGWYEEARDWAADEALLSDTGMVVDPKENCPRGAVITFLFRNYN